MTFVKMELVSKYLLFADLPSCLLILALTEMYVSAIDNSAIQQASFAGDCELVDLLLSDQRVDPRANNNTSLLKAAQNGHLYLYVVRLLLQDARVGSSSLG